VRGQRRHQAEGDVRRRADLQRDPPLAQLRDQGVVLQRPDAVPDALGTTDADRRAALVVASKDPAATQRAVRALESLAKRSGDVSELNVAGVDAGFAVRRDRGDDELLVASAGNRFVVALGRRALTEALAGSGARLGDAPAFRDAAAKLGGDVRPSFFVDVQRLATAKQHGGGGDRGRELREYLGAFDAVIGGARRDGDTTRGAAIATLR
jgi:hypothetical protein